MPEFESIVLLPAQPAEFERKSGGGKTPPPIVPVTPELREALIGQLSAVASVVDSAAGIAAAQGVPLAITVRDEALAKSKRPYGLLASADLTPVAAERPGQLISRATTASVQALTTAIRSRDSKQDTYAISTFGSFRVWDPIQDALRVPPDSSLDDLLAEAREANRPLRVELFPWISIQSVWEGRATLREHLAAVGLPVTTIAGPTTRTSLYLRVTDEARESSLEGLYGIRSAGLAPMYSTPRPVVGQSFRTIRTSLSVSLPPPDLDEVDTLVGVFDSGVAAGVLDPWVSRRWAYDVGSDRDETHGTFVAGLVVAGRALNGDNRFPDCPARIFDAQILPNGHISEDMLIVRLAEVLADAGTSGPRVWNCSFNADLHMDPVSYSTLGQELDLLAREHGILFVQSAGNYGTLRRSWPPDGSAGVHDGLASPAEGIDSLTVGGLSHRGGMAPVGAPASYSRRGPSFGGQQKPEVGHWSGDLDASGALAGFGSVSLGPSDQVMESVGTSFSTPVVSSIAARIWRDLEIGQAVRSIDPVLVKGLVVHSAAVENMPIHDDFRIYYGAGVPRPESMALLDLPHTFTTIHEVDLRTGVNWEKRPFPMPDCLFNDGKVRAAVTLTVAYAPFIDAAFGDECIRTCVEPSFGRYTVKNGSEKFEGQMGGGHDWERHLVERGKWSPIKTYRKVWPQGVGSPGDWALKLRLTARDASIEPLEQKAYVVVTVEGLADDLPVYQDGLVAIRRLHYPSSLVVDSGRLRIRP